MVRADVTVEDLRLPAGRVAQSVNGQPGRFFSPTELRQEHQVGSVFGSFEALCEIMELFGRQLE